MEECGSDLGNHWYPCGLHAVQESLGKVKHAQKVNTRQVDENVLPCVLTDSLVLAKSTQYWLRKEEYYEEGHEDYCVDDTCTIEVHSTEVKLSSSKGLGNESLQGSIHAHYDVQCKGFENRCSKAKSCQLVCIIELSRINGVDEVDQLHEDARDYRRPRNSEYLPSALAKGNVFDVRFEGSDIKLLFMLFCGRLHVSKLKMAVRLIKTIKRR